MANKPYNGHKNWNHWNVSLWINNDEGLYNLARYYFRLASRETAARQLFEHLADEGTTKTPDGAPYSVSAIKAAMVGM